MADKSKIQWTSATWQVSGGCTRASPGCQNCYAERLVGTRQRHVPSRRDLTVMRGDGEPHWTGKIALYPENLAQPLKWSRPRRIFVDSLSDLFHTDVPFEFIDKVFAIMALCPRHTFQILTKRPERMREYMSRPWCADDHISPYIDRLPDDAQWQTRHPLPNVWLGVSAEDQERADERIPLLFQTPAAVRLADRYGVTRHAEQYCGWQALPESAEADTVTPQHAATWLSDLLGGSFLAADILRDEATLGAAYRQAAKLLHPDAGGDQERFVRLGQMADVIRKHQGKTAS